ncbi:hypothetical protein FQZ97_892010 [compost metagenome]
MVGGEKAGLGEGIPGGLGFRDQGDPSAVEGRLVGIAFLVVRGEVLRGDFPGGVQGGIEHLAVVLGITRALQQRLAVEQFVELETQLALVKQQVGHGASH